MALRSAPKPIFIDFEGVIGEWVTDNTPPTQYSDFLEIESIEVSVPEQETVKLIGRRTSTLGLAVDSQNRATDSVASLAMKVNTFHPALVALAMGASVAETSQSAGDVALDTVTTVLNVWIPLANYALADHDTLTAITLKSSADVTVVVDARSTTGQIMTASNTGTAKYQIDLELGMIRAVHADAVGVGMKLSYDKAARTWEEYQAGAATSQYVHIMGKATNEISKQVGMLDIWRANLAPAGPFLMPSGEKHFQGAFAGDLITPTVVIRGAIPTRPWRFRDRTA